MKVMKSLNVGRCILLGHAFGTVALVAWEQVGVEFAKFPTIAIGVLTFGLGTAGLSSLALVLGTAASLCAVLVKVAPHTVANLAFVLGERVEGVEALKLQTFFLTLGVTDAAVFTRALVSVEDGADRARGRINTTLALALVVVPNQRGLAFFLIPTLAVACLNDLDFDILIRHYRGFAIGLGGYGNGKLQQKPRLAEFFVTCRALRIRTPNPASPISEKGRWVVRTPLVHFQRSALGGKTKRRRIVPGLEPMLSGNWCRCIVCSDPVAVAREVLNGTIIVHGGNKTLIDPRNILHLNSNHVLGAWGASDGLHYSVPIGPRIMVDKGRCLVDAVNVHALYDVVSSKSQVEFKELVLDDYWTLTGTLAHINDNRDALDIGTEFFIFGDSMTVLVDKDVIISLPSEFLFEVFVRLKKFLTGTVASVDLLDAYWLHYGVFGLADAQQNVARFVGIDFVFAKPDTFTHIQQCVAKELVIFVAVAPFDRDLVDGDIEGTGILLGQGKADSSGSDEELKHRGK